MPVVIERRFGPLDEIEFLTAEDMREIGLLVRETIYRRTIAGIDADGVPFQSYSPGYAKVKAAALGPGGVNLQVSGNMLNHLQVIDADETSVTLGWVQ